MGETKLAWYMKTDLQYLIGLYYIFLYSLQKLLILGKKRGCKSPFSGFKDMNGDKFLG